MSRRAADSELTTHSARIDGLGLIVSEPRELALASETLPAVQDGADADAGEM